MKTYTLVPAVLRKEDVAAAFRTMLLLNPAHMDHYRAGSSVAWMLTPDEHDWNCESRAVCAGGSTGPVIGFLAANHDRECHTVVNIGIVRLSPEPAHIRLFARALADWFESLRSRTLVVRWSASEDQPALHTYRRIAKRYGGGEVGRFAHAHLSPGKAGHVAQLWFEVPGRLRLVEAT